MNKNKKGGFISFILPYVLIIGIIVTLLIMFGGMNKTNNKVFAQGDIVTFIEADYVKEGEDGYDEFMDKVDDSYLWNKKITAMNFKLF